MACLECLPGVVCLWQANRLMVALIVDGCLRYYGVPAPPTRQRGHGKLRQYDAGKSPHDDVRKFSRGEFRDRNAKRVLVMTPARIRAYSSCVQSATVSVHATPSWTQTHPTPTTSTRTLTFRTSRLCNLLAMETTARSASFSLGTHESHLSRAASGASVCHVQLELKPRFHK